MSMPADGLDLAHVQLHNTHDVRTWPATSLLQRLEFAGNGVHVEHSKNLGQGSWPDFTPPGWDGALQYTLWIFLNLGGTWHGSGCIQFWRTCERNGGPPEEFAANWYYAADRWAPMTGHQPTRGERVGFMVSAGDARNAGVVSVQERSNIVVVPFPASGDVYTAPAAPVVEPPGPDSAPAGQEAPSAEPSALAGDLAEMRRLLTSLVETTATKDDIRQLRQEAVNLGRTLTLGNLGGLLPRK